MTIEEQRNNNLGIMDIQKIQQYKSAFDLIEKSIKDDEGNTIEVWYARELQQVLGYARWENFVVAIGRAMESCKALGINVDDHFREVTKMIALADYLPPLRRLGAPHPPLLPQRHVGQSPMLRPACLFLLII